MPYKMSFFQTKLIPCERVHEYSSPLPLCFHHSTCKAVSTSPHCLFVLPQKTLPAGKSCGTLMFMLTIFHFKRMQLFAVNALVWLTFLISSPNKTAQIYHLQYYTLQLHEDRTLKSLSDCEVSVRRQLKWKIVNHIIIDTIWCFSVIST